jgi:hypothetical protein
MKQLVDVAPHWGEPCISYVFDVLCAMCVCHLSISYLLLCIMNRSDSASVLTCDL